MEEEKNLRFPGEVVETFRLPDRPVVETYTRPLPKRMRPAPPEKNPKRRRRNLCIFLACALATAVLAGLAWWRPWEYLYRPPLSPDDYYNDFYDGPDDGALTVDLPRYEPEAPLEISLAVDHGPVLSAQEIYRLVNPAVAMIQVQEGDSGYLGTGVVFTADGYLLTNYHVVEGGETCKVLLADNSVYWASYVTGDRGSDIAVLKIDGGNLPAAELADSDLLTVGDKVYAIGNPLNAELRGTFTDGIVSAIDRSVSVEDRNMELIQTNAALNSGNSGGPLVNEYGQVIGINAIKMVSRYSNIEGLGFAIPTASIRDIVAELMDTGEVPPDPLLGISVSQLGDPLPDGRAGLLIRSVTEGGAADRAGVREGDYLLTADGQPITFSSELYRVRRRFHAGDALVLTLWRDGEIVEVTLDLLEIS